MTVLKVTLWKRGYQLLIMQSRSSCTPAMATLNRVPATVLQAAQQRIAERGARYFGNVTNANE